MAAQRVLACSEAAALGLTEHDDPDCTAIVMDEDDGRVSSVSHFPTSLDPAVRLNLDVPAKDAKSKAMKWRMPNDEESERLGYDLEQRRRLAFVAAESGHHSHAQAAQAVGMTVAELRTEAGRKGWGRS